MKKIVLFSSIIAALSIAVFAASGIKIKGSDTVLPITQRIAEKYMKSHAGSSITVTGGGSGVGISSLLDGTTDIAMSSRKIKMDEKLKLQEQGKNIKEVQVAWDALSFIVHPSNNISQITKEQLEGIFTGKIINWKQLGGADMAIVAYSRESSSGTYEFVKEKVLSKKNFGAKVLSMPATGAIVQSVSQTKGAIGYVGFAYVEKNVKDLKVSYDKGKTYIEPTYANATSKIYPIVRPLFYYYDSKIEKTVKPLLDYILSAEGQGIVKEVGYITLK
jgi:phosphate transport system substrate-binding protein